MQTLEELRKSMKEYNKARTVKSRIQSGAIKNKDLKQLIKKNKFSDTIKVIELEVAK